MNPGTQFWSAGGLLLVGHPDAGTIAFREDDLAERWRQGAPGLREPTFSYTCGVVICRRLDSSVGVWQL